MKSTNDIDNFNDLIIQLQEQLSKDRFKKELLIREAFTLWYVLVEGIKCENLTEEDLRTLLIKNHRLYATKFINDADYNFIMGWMINISFWYFDSSIKEQDGSNLLVKAYHSNPKNSLFKWAVRDQLRLKDDEINNLRVDMSLRFEQFYNYGILIREYFLDVINTPH